MIKKIKKINRKCIVKPSENIASQNTAAVRAPYKVYAVIALWIAGIVYYTGKIFKLGCTCRCRCASKKNVMAAAQGYSSHAVTYAR